MTFRRLVRAALPWTLASLVCAAGPSAAARPHRHFARQHVHASARARPQRGLASYFSVRKSGRRTADGKPLRATRMVAASKTLPLGTEAKVTNLHNGRSVKVKVVDRGPYVRRRIIDVSPKAARKLGMRRDGVALVRVRPLRLPGPAR